MKTAWRLTGCFIGKGWGGQACKVRKPIREYSVIDGKSLYPEMEWNRIEENSLKGNGKLQSSQKRLRQTLDEQ